MVQPATRSVPCANARSDLARNIRGAADNIAAAPFRRELRLLALFWLPLSQSDAGATAVLVDELDTRGFQGSI